MSQFPASGVLFANDRKQSDKQAPPSNDLNDDIPF